MTQNFPFLDIPKGDQWFDVTTALGLAAGTPLVLQNTGTVTLYISSSENEPSNIKEGIRAPVGSQVYDARPIAPEKTWARCKTKDGRLGIQS